MTGFRWDDQFMQPDITVKQSGWHVETLDAGTCFVPGDVYGVPDWLAADATFTADGASMCSMVFAELCAGLADYCEGRNIQSIAVCNGYFARLSAPGYMDRTEWCLYSTVREARSALRDLAGD